MSSPFLAEIRVFSFGFAPKGWAQCNGQLLPINQNQALFALLGTQYGGDGRVTFALPDLRGRVPLHASAGIPQGSSAGQADVTLTAAQMPSHSHQLLASDGSVTNAGTVLGHPGGRRPIIPYGVPGGLTPLRGDSVTTVGGQSHDNMQPYLSVNVCIALQGIFPSRN